MQQGIIFSKAQSVSIKRAYGLLNRHGLHVYFVLSADSANGFGKVWTGFLGHPLPLPLLTPPPSFFISVLVAFVGSSLTVSVNDLHPLSFQWITRLLQSHYFKFSRLFLHSLQLPRSTRSTYNIWFPPPPGLICLPNGSQCDCDLKCL